MPEYISPVNNLFAFRRGYILTFSQKIISMQNPVHACFQQLTVYIVLTFTSSSLAGSVRVFPISTSSPDTLIPGEIIPSSSSLSYTACLMPTTETTSSQAQISIHIIFSSINHRHFSENCLILASINLILSNIKYSICLKSNIGQT